MIKLSLITLLTIPIMILCTSCSKEDENSMNDNQQNNNEMILSEYQSVEEDNNITLKLVTDNPSCLDEYIEIEIGNQSSKTIEYSDEYELDVYQDDKWYVVKHKPIEGVDAFVWSLIGYETAPYQDSNEKIYLGTWDVSKGHYRLIKTFDGSNVIGVEFDLADE